mmetsp:Transcript_18326/g.32759  ORF Transcript_18326/g.32759 Transcript_18326/m.32759 type:complete len:338 (-) Transcript_18326:85-1098(-)
MLFNRSTLNSIPISNKKKTMPNSAKCSVVCISEIAPKPFGPSNMPAAKNPKMGDVPAILHSGVIIAVAKSSISVSDLAPDMYFLRSANASRKVLRVWVDSSPTALALVFLVATFAAPPRISSHWLTMVRSTGERGGWSFCRVECLARVMMELSMPDLEATLLAVVVPPPRAITDEADAAEPAIDDGDCCWESNKSACRPVLMKKRAENAMARLANFFLNCSRFDDALLPRILCDIWYSVDFTLSRMFIDGFLSPLLVVSALIDSRVLLRKVVVVAGNGGRRVGREELPLVLLATDTPNLFGATDRASTVTAAIAKDPMAIQTRRMAIDFFIFLFCVQ